jgi:hypothetical protein
MSKVHNNIDKCKCGRPGNFCMVEDWLYGDQQPYCKKCYMEMRGKSSTAKKHTEPKAHTINEPDSCDNVA